MPESRSDPKIANYLEQLRVHKRLSSRTIDIYADALGLLQVHCEELRLAASQIQHTHIRHWIIQAHAAGLNPRTLALRLSSWRGFFKWLVQEGHMTHNPCQDIRPPKPNKPLPKALSVDEAMQFAQATQQSHDPGDAQAPLAWLRKRDQLIFELLYGCGLRVSELVGLDFHAHAQTLTLNRGWVDAQSQEVHVFGKGAKRRMVPLGQLAAKAYAAYLPERQLLASHHPHEYALLINSHGKRLTRQAVWQLIRQYSRAAKLSHPVHPHMLRHSYASHVLQSSHDLRAVQELLGHSSIASTQVYTQLDFQHLAQIYDNSHPRAK